jgi:hypothetical protein
MPPEGMPPSSSPLWHQTRCRPLQPGLSIGHFSITAGTLGCFVSGRRTKEHFILSNNHVLANEDAAKAGDDIIQAGRLDRGRRPKDRIGGLNAAWIPLKRQAANLVDCALSTIDDEVEVDYRTLRGVGGSESTCLSGIAPDEPLDQGATVHKVGRTTGATSGRISAFEIDELVVSYGKGNLRFDNQVEIEGVDGEPFSDGGDSGSLIVDAEYRGLALLFAGSDIGGSNGLGVTYANPLGAVLENLRVDLLY